MKIFTLAVSIFIFLIAGCATSRQTVGGSNPFIIAFNNAEKNNGNGTNVKKLEEIYFSIQKTQADIISRFSQSTAEERWDSLFTAYKTLQEIYQTVANSSCCSKLLPVSDYQQALNTTREDAAAYYYRKAELLAKDTQVAGIRQAVAAYEKTSGFVQGYRDSDQKRLSLFTNNNFIVGFNFSEDSLSFSAKGLSADFYKYSNQTFINDIISEIDISKSSIPFLVLLPYDDCLSNKLSPDWIVNISIPEASTNHKMKTKTRTVKFKPELIGIDSSGHNYRYDTAREYRTYNCELIDYAHLQVSVDITETVTGNSILSRRFYTDNGQVSYENCNEAIGTLDNLYKNSMKEKMIANLYLKVYVQYKEALKKTLER
jgi:hypothetical protein